MNNTHHNLWDLMEQDHNVLLTITQESDIVNAVLLDNMHKIAGKSEAEIRKEFGLD